MAEYYNNQFGGGRNRNKRNSSSIWLTLLDVVMMAISVATALTLLIIFVGRFFEPETLWYFSLAGLVAPIVYMVAIALMLYWIIRWKWKMFLFTTAFVVLGFPFVSLYCKINIGKEYGEPRYERGNIKILSYNVRYMYDDEGLKNSTDSILAFINEVRPDIICLQELPTQGAQYDKVMSSLSKYHHSKIYPEADDGVVCFSKYRIIRSDSIVGFCDTGKGIWADLKINDDTVRLYNMHLQTTSIKPEERDYINNKRFLESADSGRVQKFANMAERLFENSCKRAHQANTLRHDMAHCRYPMIVCGDFNDIPMSYAYRTIAGKLTDTFSEQGNGYVHTFRGFFGLLRIDYILVSKQFQTLSYEVVPTDLSDHLPVISRVILKNDK